MTECEELIMAVENLLTYMPHGARYNGPWSLNTDMRVVKVASDTVRRVLYEMQRSDDRKSLGDDYDDGNHWLDFGDN